MKKLALTNLIVLIAIKSVSACEDALDRNKAISDAIQQENFNGYYFLAAFALILPIIYLYFLRKQQGLWTIVTGSMALLLYIPSIFAAYLLGPCSDQPVPMVIKVGFTLMAILFSFQLFSWISQRKTSIKMLR